LLAIYLPGGIEKNPGVVDWVIMIPTYVFSGGFLGTATFSGFGALVELGWVYIPLRL